MLPNWTLSTPEHRASSALPSTHPQHLSSPAAAVQAAALRVWVIVDRNSNCHCHHSRFTVMQRSSVFTPFDAPLARFSRSRLLSRMTRDLECSVCSPTRRPSGPVDASSLSAEARLWRIITGGRNQQRRIGQSKALLRWIFLATRFFPLTAAVVPTDPGRDSWRLDSSTTWQGKNAFGLGLIRSQLHSRTASQHLTRKFHLSLGVD